MCGGGEPRQQPGQSLLSATHSPEPSQPPCLNPALSLCPSSTADLLLTEEAARQLPLTSSLLSSALLSLAGPEPSTQCSFPSLLPRPSHGRSKRGSSFLLGLSLKLKCAHRPAGRAEQGGGSEDAAFFLIAVSLHAYHPCMRPSPAPPPQEAPHSRRGGLSPWAAQSAGGLTGGA